MGLLKCAFNHPLMVGEFRCNKARSVVRRGGPDVDCESEAAQRRCTRLFARLKAASLPAMDLPDDPLSMPHSIHVKIQSGGLSGIKRMLKDTQDDDVASMVRAAVRRFHGIDAIPLDELILDITNYRLRRRRK